MRAVAARPNLRLRVAGAVTAALFAAGLLVTPDVGAAPTDADIAAAEEAEDLAEMSVSQLEVHLADVKADAAQAETEAAIAAEAVNGAKLELEEATATAQTAEDAAADAQAAFEAGQKDMSSIAQVAYRGGPSSLDAFVPYLAADGLETIENRQNVVSSLGAAVDTQLQGVVALQQVADVTATAAAEAETAKSDALAQVAEKQAAAESAASAAAASADAAAADYEAGLAELAKRQNTTVALVREQQEAAEAAQQEALKQRALAAAAEEESTAEPAPAAKAPAAEAPASQQPAAQQPTAEKPAASAPAAQPKPAATPAQPKPAAKPAPAPAPKPAPKPAPAPAPKPAPAPVSSGGGSAAATAVQFARSKVGGSYVWGGEGPGYDCSGLVKMAYAQSGKRLSHYTVSQYDETARISASQLQPGDLVFYGRSHAGIWHVAIWVGNGRIIDALNPRAGIVERAMDYNNVFGYGRVR